MGRTYETGTNAMALYRRTCGKWQEQVCQRGFAEAVKAAAPWDIELICCAFPVSG